MCYAVKCDKCKKTTWGGCGNHIASVKDKVPAAQWCNCERKPAAPASAMCNIS